MHGCSMRIPICYQHIHNVVPATAVKGLLFLLASNKGGVWRPYKFTPTHSLTGPVGQLLASRLGGQRFASQDLQTHN
jgi:hypothetical protein